MLRDRYNIQKGDRIVICSANIPQYLVAFWACQLIGAIPVLVNIWLPEKPLVHCILHTGSVVVLIDTERADRIAPKLLHLQNEGVRGVLVMDSLVHHSRWEHCKLWDDVLKSVSDVDLPQFLAQAVDVSPEDDATIVFTSGTTGLPKGVLSSYRAYLRAGERLPNSSNDGPQTGMLVGVPLFHVSGLTSFSMLATLSGMKIILMSKWDMKDAVRCSEFPLYCSLSSFLLVPSLISDLIDSDLQGHPFKFFLFGGAPAYPQLPKKAKDVFPHAMLTHSFGMTETNAVCVAIAGEDYERRPTSCGIPCPVNDMMVVRDGKKVTDGSPGEVWLRGPNVMTGYWGEPGATELVLTRDDWYKTGDLGCIDSEGYLHIRDRIKDIIIRNGENIDSTTVENAIYLDDRVYQAAAVGIPDPRLGEMVAVVVSEKNEYRGKVRRSELLNLARKNFVCQSSEVCLALLTWSSSKIATLLTPSGKIMKQPLRALAHKEWVRQQTEQQPTASSRL
ncbi:hypothetical protein EIP91_001500 [Steccherinum ochraceum]|uniref:AMP-dependent synthetase/ligase domain-containing protein n=1 Tax=Steccherinum ochraceum TaxID=92696 RepID=A0A4R0RPN5_9APHY|nr:hypothetical protein EIP91_001500 [Steccherinum ochraceum]